MKTIEEIKNILTDAFSNILFNEEDHEYVLNGYQLTSVTQNLANYVVDFNSYYAAESAYKNALKKNPNTTLTAAYFRQRWDLIGKEASAKGTRVHLYAEAYPDLQEPRDEKEEGVIEAYKYFEDNGYEVIFKEFVVYDDEYKKAGTIDLILYNKKTGNIVLADWKTNDKHLFESKKGRNLKGVFKEYQDTSYNQYSIQLSHYQYMIEKVTDLIVEDKILIWLNSNPRKKKGDYVYQRVDTLYKSDNVKMYLCRNLKDKIKKELLSRKDDIISKVKMSTTPYYKLKDKNKKALSIAPKKNVNNKSADMNFKIDLSAYLK